MFEGFTPETFDFLWGIRMNNNRAWFQPHKEQYVTTLYQPMKELGAQLFQPFLDRPGTLLKVSRIYRDARLHYPDPYKESLWLCIRQDVDWWAENPCLFFEIRPEGVSYGFGLVRPRTATMEDFRRAIAAQPEPFLDMAARTEAETGLPITAKVYKRPKLSPDPRLDRFYAWREEICCIREEGVGPNLFTPELGGRVETLFGQLMELYDYFCRFRV